MTQIERSNSSEEYEQLKVKLQNLGTQQAVKVIMLTACNEGDGVSTVARNLASVLSSGALANVLLFNLATNKNTNKLKVGKTNDTLSFSEDIQQFLIQKDNTLLNTLRKTPENFSLLSMKPDFHYASDFFQSVAFKDLLDIFKTQYDYIILDAPPILTSPGCLALGTQADGVILVLRSEHTRREVVKNAKYQIECTGGKLLGAVINMKKHHIPNFIYHRL